MEFSLLTYNLCTNTALKYVTEDIVKMKPDFICFQEISTHPTAFKMVEKLGYELAGYSHSFIKYGKLFGIATFYKKDKFKFLNSTNYNLPRSYYEIALILLRGGSNPRTFMRTDFEDRKTGDLFSVYNIHLTPIGTNNIRIKQFREVLLEVSENTKTKLMMAGDFNYPYGRRHFQRLIDEFQLKEATTNIFFTSIQRFFWFLRFEFKLDYILYRNIKVIDTKKLSFVYSDHYPILTRFTIS